MIIRWQRVLRRAQPARLFSTLKSWERSAKLVKNTDVTNQYLDHIRAAHDPALHIKTLEDELRGTMGKALGKQGEKITFALRGMQEQRELFEKLVQNKHASCTSQIRECVEIHNDYRKQAQQARWELIVHRQAIGFLVNNQKFVHEKYPIGDALPLPDDDGRIVEEEKKPKEDEKQYGDQLDWWQRIGRWR